MNKPVIEGAHRPSTLLAQRRSLFWRIHFWAALIASPFALIAALTGILYIFVPQIEQALYGQLDHVAPAGPMLPLNRSVAAALTGAPPGMAILTVVPPLTSRDAVRVTLAPAGPDQTEHAGHQATRPAVPDKPGFGGPAEPVVVYVSPYDATVLGSLPASERFSDWTRRLHSRLLQGEQWRMLIELAASWLMVMLLTGVWLSWPRTGAPFLPRPGASGRLAWKQWHAFLGVTLGLVTLVILTTGLTWSKYAGEQVRAARDAVGQAPPRAPRELRSHPSPGAAMLQWQAAWDATRRLAPDVAVQLIAPQSAHGVWKANAADPGQPTRRFELLLDAYTGKPLYYAGWERQTMFSKATAVGIPFHRGEFGWWNQALLLVFGLGIVFSLASGWIMYFKRPRAQLLSPPRMLPGAWRSASPASWAVGAALCVLMPLLAVSASLLVVVELALARRRAAH